MVLDAKASLLYREKSKLIQAVAKILLYILRDIMSRTTSDSAVFNAIAFPVEIEDHFPGCTFEHTSQLDDFTPSVPDSVKPGE